MGGNPQSPVSEGRSTIPSIDQDNDLEDYAPGDFEEMFAIDNDSNEGAYGSTPE